MAQTEFRQTAWGLRTTIFVCPPKSAERLFTEPDQRVAEGSAGWRAATSETLLEAGEEAEALLRYPCVSLEMPVT